MYIIRNKRKLSFKESHLLLLLYVWERKREKGGARWKNSTWEVISKHKEPCDV